MRYKKSVFRSLAMVSQLGLCVVTPVFLCIFVGYQLDSRFGTNSMIPLLLLGVLGGGRGAYKLAQQTLLQEQKDDERERQAARKNGVRIGLSNPKQPSRIHREKECEIKKEENGNDGMA